MGRGRERRRLLAGDRRDGVQDGAWGKPRAEADARDGRRLVVAVFVGVGSVARRRPEGGERVLDEEAALVAVAPALLCLQVVEVDLHIHSIRVDCEPTNDRMSRRERSQTIGEDSTFRKSSGHWSASRYAKYSRLAAQTCTRERTFCASEREPAAPDRNTSGGAGWPEGGTTPPQSRCSRLHSACEPRRHILVLYLKFAVNTEH